MANEQQTAISFAQDVLSICKNFEFKAITFFIIIDNASKDDTKSIMDEFSKQVKELTIIFAPENRSVVDAYVRGYNEALNASCDWILEIDAGYSHLPTDIPIFFTTMLDGYDCIFGNRFHNTSTYAGNSPLRYILSRGGTLLANFMLGSRQSDMTSGFELFNAETLRKILGQQILSKGPFFQTEIKFHAKQFKHTEVPISYKNGSHKIRLLTIHDAMTNLLRLTLKRFFH